MAGQLDILMVANNTMVVTIDVKRRDGTLVDMTVDHVGKWCVFKHGTAIPLITKTSGSGDITMGNGFISFTIEPEDTKTLQKNDLNEYIHEAVIVDGLGKVVTLTDDDPRVSWGAFVIRKQLTVPDA